MTLTQDQNIRKRLKSLNLFFEDIEDCRSKGLINAGAMIGVNCGEIVNTEEIPKIYRENPRSIFFLNQKIDLDNKIKTVDINTLPYMVDVVDIHAGRKNTLDEHDAICILNEKSNIQAAEKLLEKHYSVGVFSYSTLPNSKFFKGFIDIQQLANLILSTKTIYVDNSIDAEYVNMLNGKWQKIEDFKVVKNPNYLDYLGHVCDRISLS